MRRKWLVRAAIVLAVALLVAVGLWRGIHHRADLRTLVVRHPERVMGTTCTLAAVVEPRRKAEAERTLKEAEAALRAVEAHMSIWLADSEISRLNAAPAVKEVALSPDTAVVLQSARDAAEETGGAFDITCGPVIELWKRAGQVGRLPSEAEIADARQASSWELIALTQRAAVKRASAARVDLGGIAKGYAVDRAVGILQGAGLTGGVVDVGGDMRCFGLPPKGSAWEVDIKDPFEEGVMTVLQVRSGAVCTSGNYARFTVIEGERYSHIVDPRSGRPAEAVPSVTVVAADALTADVWASALSVLGEQGFALLPEGVDALMVAGSQNDYQLLCTANFARLLAQPVPGRLRIWEMQKAEKAAVGAAP
jgi:thiamine biosynthesis lipoprotein